MPKKFFGTVITPVVGMERTCMIALSTIQGQDNYYSQLLNLRDETTGRPFFNIYKFNLACDACIASNQAKTCEHRLDELPEYLAPAKQLQIRQILRQIGLDAALEQETLNLSSSANDACFPSGTIENLFSKKEYVLSPSDIKDAKIPYVWCFIDPNNGGGSDLSICSAFQYRGSFVFCGGELLNTTTNSVAIPWIFRHFQGIRSQPKLEDALIFLFVENNSPMLVNELLLQINNKKAVRDVIPINRFGFDTETVQLNHTTTKKHHGNAISHGSVTTDVLKEKATEFFALGLDNNLFNFYETFCCVYSTQPNNPKHDQKREYMKSAKLQLQNWSRCMKHMKDEMFVSKVKYTYSGKHAGRDDGAVSILMLTYYIHFHVTERMDMIKEMLQKRIPLML